MIILSRNEVYIVTIFPFSFISYVGELIILLFHSKFERYLPLFFLFSKIDYPKDIIP